MRKIIWVECKDMHENITRIQSKTNLKAVLEYGIKKKPNNESFDKIWYISRSSGFIRKILSS